MTISAPGIYHGMPTAEYFADCCPRPSLTQSIAKVLLEKSPLHAWHCHPKLNPDYREDQDTKFDVGNIAHKLMIGRGKDIEIFDAPDWNATGMGKGAKIELHAKRDAARAAGKVAVLGKSYMRAQAMVRAARQGLDLVDVAAFVHGHGEVVIAWQESGLWFRSMIDWVTATAPVYCDYKTSGMSVAPHGIGRMLVAAGWDVQAAFQERGLDVLDPDNAGRRKFRFVAQEDEPPYALTVCELPEAVMTMGRKKVDHAIRIWRECVETDRFPAYPPEIAFPQYPGWAESQWLERELAVEERRATVPGEKMLTDISGG